MTLETTDHTRNGGASRRRFLGVTAGALAGLGGLAGVRARAQSQPEIIRLGGEVDGWTGRTPERVAGETNPTLPLDAGRRYRIRWENLDGQPHNIALLSDDGSTIKRTETISEQGATQTIEFTARTAMAEYLCEVHPTTMRGDLDVSGAGSGTAGGNGTATNETTGEETTTAGSDVEPYFPNGASVRLETIVEDGPDSPLDFEVPPGTNDRRFIVDRAGAVSVHTADGLREEPFIDVGDELAEITGEMGLVGMAFHPNYQRNRKFYLRYSAPNREGTPEDFDHTEVLSEFTATDDGRTGKPDSERTILEIPSPQSIHNSGAVTFGPDGYLYMGMGDGGGGDDDNLGHAEDWYEPLDGGNGQDVTENLLGSVLRIDVDGREGDKPYAIPEDNPLVGTDGLDEHFAWGLRNPWRIGFSNGKLFVADVGQNVYEEVDIVRRGGNYGWSVREGSHCFRPDLTEPPNGSGSTSTAENCPTKLPENVRGGERLVDPIIDYPHSYNGRGVGSAVIGGYVYDNDRVPALTGKYVFGDFRKNIDIEEPSGSLFAATPANDGQWSVEELTVENGDEGRVGAFVLALGRDNAGELYVLTTSDHDPGEGTGAVHRIAPAQSSGQTPSGSSTAGTATGGTATAGGPAGTDNGTAGVTTAATRNGAGTTSGGTGTPGNEGGEANGGGGSGTGGSGPGFGVFAAIAGLALGAARLLGDD